MAASLITASRRRIGEAVAPGGAPTAATDVAPPPAPAAAPAAAPGAGGSSQPAHAPDQGAALRGVLRAARHFRPRHRFNATTAGDAADAAAAAAERASPPPAPAASVPTSMPAAPSRRHLSDAAAALGVSTRHSRSATVAVSGLRDGPLDTMSRRRLPQPAGFGMLPSSLPAAGLTGPDPQALLAAAASYGRLPVTLRAPSSRITLGAGTSAMGPLPLQATASALRMRPLAISPLIGSFAVSSGLAPLSGGTGIALPPDALLRGVSLPRHMLAAGAPHGSAVADDDDDDDDDDGEDADGVGGLIDDAGLGIAGAGVAMHLAPTAGGTVPLSPKSRDLATMMGWGGVGLPPTAGLSAGTGKRAAWLCGPCGVGSAAFCGACCCGRTWLPRSRARTAAQRFCHAVHLAASGDRRSTLGAAVQNLIVTTIFYSIALLIVETLPRYRVPTAPAEQPLALAIFAFSDIAIAAVFSLEYFVRLLTCAFVPGPGPAASAAAAAAGGAAMAAAAAAPGSRSVGGGILAAALATAAAEREAETGRCGCLVTLMRHSSMTIHTVLTAGRRVVAFVLSTGNLIDLASFITLYVRLGVAVDAASSAAIVLQVVKLARIVRLLKLTYRSASFQLLVRTLASSAFALFLLLVWMVILVVFFGAVMFYAESGEWSPSAGTWIRASIDGTGTEATPFVSIAHAFYYCMVTITTVGYGDFVPTSIAGRLISSLVMVAGVLMIALPISVIGERFQENYNRFVREQLARQTQQKLSTWALAQQAFLASAPSFIVEPGGGGGGYIGGSAAASASPRGSDGEDGAVPRKQASTRSRIAASRHGSDHSSDDDGEGNDGEGLEDLLADVVDGPGASKPALTTATARGAEAKALHSPASPMSPHATSRRGPPPLAVSQTASDLGAAVAAAQLGGSDGGDATGLTSPGLAVSAPSADSSARSASGGVGFPVTTAAAAVPAPVVASPPPPGSATVIAGARRHSIGTVPEAASTSGSDSEDEGGGGGDAAAPQRRRGSGRRRRSRAGSSAAAPVATVPASALVELVAGLREELLAFREEATMQRAAVAMLQQELAAALLSADAGMSDDGGGGGGGGGAPSPSHSVIVNPMPSPAPPRLSSRRGGARGGGTGSFWGGGDGTAMYGDL